MEENYGPNFITLTDEEGNEIELEHLDTIEWDGTTYLSFFPVEQEGEDNPEEELGLIILKVIEENGEDLLSTLESDEEIDLIYQKFMENLFDEEENTE